MADGTGVDETPDNEPGAPEPVDANDLARWLIVGGLLLFVGSGVFTQAALIGSPDGRGDRAAAWGIAGLLAFLGSIYGARLVVRFARRCPVRRPVRMASAGLVAGSMVMAGSGGVFGVDALLRDPKVLGSIAPASAPSLEVELDAADVDLPPGWQDDGAADGIVAFYRGDVSGNVVVTRLPGPGSWSRSEVRAFAHECLAEIESLPAFEQRAIHLDEWGERSRFRIEFDFQDLGEPRSGRMEIAIVDGIGVTTTSTVPRGTLDEHDAQLDELAESVEAGLLPA